LKSLILYTARRLSDPAFHALNRALRDMALARILHRIDAASPLRTVYDIGAHKGDWTRAMEKVLPRADFVLFDANPANAPHLEKTGRHVVLGPLAAEAGEVAFYATGGTGDSIYRENTAAYDGVAPTTMTAQTLDGACADAGLAPPDFLKIDTQGAELDVLAGGAAAAGHARAILTECPIVQYNDGAPRLHEYIDARADLDYLPQDVFEVHNQRGVLLQIDVLFLKRAVLYDLFPTAAQKYGARL